MSDINTYGKGTSLSKLLLYVLFASVCGLLFYNYFKNTNFGKGADYSSVPKEMQIKYIPSDYQFDGDDETTLAIITNPDRYQREFNQLIYDFNLSMLHHVANRMDLADSIKVTIEAEYEKHHPYMRDMYYKDFVKIRDTSANLYESWYDNNFNSATEALNEVASNYSCYLVNQVIMNSLYANGGKLVGTGNSVETPCMIAMQESLKPLIRRLEQKAAIKDFSASKGLMEKKVEKAIAEIGTMEVRDRKGLSKQLQTKIWGYAVSSTDIEVSAISILKVGFKLDRYFDISVDSGRKRVTVTLPEPEILSHEVYPKIDALDVGWMRELSSEDFNKNFNVLRREFRRDALEDNIMRKSKVQAEDIMKLMMEPITKQMGGRFKLLIKFKNVKNNNSEDDFFETADANLDN